MLERAMTKLSRSFMPAAFAAAAMAAGAIFAGTAQAASRVEIKNHVPIPITKGDGSPATQAQTRAAILAAALKYGWAVVDDAPEKIQLKLDHRRRKMMLTLDVPYTAGTFSIRYVSSEGMQYAESRKKRTIHEFYKRWVDFLTAAIAGTVAPVSGPGEDEAQGAPEPPVEAASELPRQ